VNLLRTLLHTSPLLTLAALVACLCLVIALYRWLTRAPIRGFVFFGLVALVIAFATPAIRTQLFGA
jgi:O-antigen ligase